MVRTICALTMSAGAQAAPGLCDSMQSGFGQSDPKVADAQSLLRRKDTDQCAIQPKEHPRWARCCTSEQLTAACSGARFDAGVCHLQINGSLARAAIKELLEEGLIKPVAHHSAQGIYTRDSAAAPA